MRGQVDLTREALSRLFVQRCFYLFVLLLVLVAAAPFFDASPNGLLLRNVINIFVIVAAVAAVGRTTESFVIVLCMAVPALLFRWLSLETDSSAHFDLALRFNAGLYVTAIFFLTRYVFERGIMDTDRLWGAAAAFLLLGVLWSVIYAIVGRSAAGSFAVAGTVKDLQFTDLIYFSFSTLTTTGFGDIVPISHAGRIAAVLESIAGQLFLAILIARLVGVYPPARSRDNPAVQERHLGARAQS